MRAAETSDLKTDDVLRQVQGIRELVLQHEGGWADIASLASFRTMSTDAARAAADTECAGMMRAADRYALDFFSAAAHENWAAHEISGVEFLRLQILRLLDAFEDRLEHLRHGRD